MITFWNVRMNDASRVLSARVLRYDRNRKAARFIGAASLKDRSGSLLAETIDYGSESGRLEATGSPRLHYPEEGWALHARAITMNALADSGWARGAVRLAAAPPDSDVVGEERRPESDTLQVEADSARFHRSGKFLAYGGPARVRMGDVSATAPTANFLQEEGGNRLQEEGGNRLQEEEGNRPQEEEGNRLQEEEGNRPQEEEGNRLQEEEGNRLQEKEGNRSPSGLSLRGGVAATWMGGAPGNAARASSDDLDVTLNEGRAEQMTFVGDVTVNMMSLEGDAALMKGGATLLVGDAAAGDDDRAMERRTRSVSADTCVVTLGEEGGMDRLEARGSVRIQVWTDEGDTTEMAGSDADIRFVDGDIDSLRIRTAAAVRHTGGRARTLSLLSGESIRIGFSDGALRHVAVEGQAVCDHRSVDEEDPDAVYLTGDAVALSFEEGRVTRAESTGGVQGRFRPPEEEAQ